MSSRSGRATPSKAGQKERLVEGMTHTAARYGFKEASVARVVEHAGVSRATFYQHFADKEACFLAAFAKAAERFLHALPRFETEYSAASRAGELLADLLANIAGMPAAARIILVEALAGGPEARLAHERFMGEMEKTFDRWLAGPGANGYRLEITGRAIMEGTGGILLMRCFRGETARVANLRDDILAWMYSYAVPEESPRITTADWRRLGAGFAAGQTESRRAGGDVRKLPRGRSAVAPERVAGEHRERILAAVARLARREGYAAMTVADVVKAAAVTREAFYEQFRSKEDAFLAVQSAGLEQTIARTAASFFVGEDWPTRIWGGLESLFGYVATQPDIVHVDVIESYAAGEAAIRRSFDNRMSYSLFFEDGYRQSRAAERLPRLCSEAITGAIGGLMRWQVAAGRTEQLLEIFPQSAYVTLAPFLGATAAIELVEAKAAAGGWAETI